jgi:hypothetical protein
MLADQEHLVKVMLADHQIIQDQALALALVVVLVP